MPRIIKPPHGGEIHLAQKGERRALNNKGRTRTKRLLTNAGYGLHDINDIIQKVLELTFEEVRDLLVDKNASILEMSIAKALQVSLRKGDLYALETLLTRRFGKPKQTVAMIETSANADMTIEAVDPVEASKRYRAIIES